MSISKERKELLTWNKKYFSSFLKGFQLSEIDSAPRVGLEDMNFWIWTLWSFCRRLMVKDNICQWNHEDVAMIQDGGID